VGGRAQSSVAVSKRYISEFLVQALAIARK